MSGSAPEQRYFGIFHALQSLRPNYTYQAHDRDNAFGRVYPSVISPDSTGPSDGRVILGESVNRTMFYFLD